MPPPWPIRATARTCNTLHACALAYCTLVQARALVRIWPVVAVSCTPVHAVYRYPVLHAWAIVALWKLH